MGCQPEFAFTFLGALEQKKLTSLQERKNGVKKLVTNDNVASLQWPLGSIARVFSGTDNFECGVNFRTQPRVYNRIVHRTMKLLLPSDWKSWLSRPFMRPCSVLTELCWFKWIKAGGICYSCSWDRSFASIENLFEKLRTCAETVGSNHCLLQTLWFPFILGFPCKILLLPILIIFAILYVLDPKSCH